MVVKGQIEALESRGHEVKLFARYTDVEEQARTYGLRSAFRVVTGFGFNFKKEMAQFAPDLILVHNLFPNISTRWLEDLTANRIIFLHNYRPWCSNGFMLRNGKHCQKCLRNPLWGSIYRCANGKFLRSLIQSLGQVFNFHLKRLENSGAKIVAVSNLTKQKISEFSNLENVRALSNFVSKPNNSNTRINNQGAKPGEKFVWAGRISPEKGLEELLNIWPSTFALDIFGAGSDLSRLKKIHGEDKSISFMGAISNEDLRAVLPHYLGFVNSSTWTEFGPMTIIEALSAGLPVLFPIGLSIGELISDYGAGNSYALSDPKSLELSLLKISDSELFKGYQQAALNLYEQEFSAEGWYKKLMNIFTNF